MTATLTTRTGEARTVVTGDPLWCRLDNTRVRYVRTERDGMIAVASNETGRELPDLRHPTQVVAY